MPERRRGHRVFDASRALLVAAITGFVFGCASTADLTQERVPAGRAILVNLGAIARLRCENADMKKVDGNDQSVCQAYLQAADGNPTSRLSSKNALAPGSHQLKIECIYSIIHPSDRGAVMPYRNWDTYEASFDEGKRYFIWADVVDGKCKVWINQEQPSPPAPLWKTLIP